MNQQIIREILWNVPVAFRIFLYGMLFPLAAAFVYEGMRWYRIVSLGQPVDAQAAGFFGFPYYLVGMMEVL